MSATAVSPRHVKFCLNRLQTLNLSSVKIISGTGTSRRRDADTEEIFANSKPYSEVPKPKGLPYFGTVLHYIFNGGGRYLHEYVHKRHAELGSIYKEKYSTEPFEVLFIGDIEGARDVYRNEGKTPLSFVIGGEELYIKLTKVKRGLLFCQGEEWLRLRRPMNHLLLRRNDYFDNFNMTTKVIEEHVVKWVNSSAGEAKVNDLGVKVNSLGVCTFGAFAFGDTFPLHRVEIEADAQNFYQLTKNYWEGNMTMQIIPPIWAHRLKLPLWSKFETAISSMLAIGNRWVQLASQDLTSPTFQELYKSPGFLHLMLQDYNNPEEESVKRVFSDFIAALESETTMLHWILYVMGQNPEAQDKLFKELTTLSTDFTWRDLESAPYLNACVKESLRMYPSNCFTVRILPEESVVKGYRVPAGTIAVVALMSAQRDPTVFPDPDRFWPERWFRSTEQNVDSLGIETEVGKPLGVHGCQPYLPFAWGSSRGCIFRRISVRRMTLFLATFVKLFKFNTQVVKPVMRTLMIPDRDIHLTVERRR